MFLVLLPCVFAVCGDGSLDLGEECDAQFDSACPGLCDQNTCTCMKDVKYVLQDLYEGHNLLFSKTMDLSHISKDASMQDELKVIQYGLRQAYVNPPNNLSCNVVPNLFMIPAQYHPYGKENEVDQFNHYLLFKLSDSTFRSQVNVSTLQFNESKLVQGIADDGLVAETFLLSGQAKCCAYNQLIEPSVLSFRIENGTCDIVPFCGNAIIEFPEQCDDGNMISGDGCSANCSTEYCGDGIIQPLLGEFCEPPNTPTCDAGCDFNQTTTTCPNATVEPGEECDPDGALPLVDPTCPLMVNGSRICGITCHCEYCGNGVVDPNEDCDDGGKCSDNNASCTLLDTSACGTPVNATCILYNGDGCSANCTTEYCGDGVVQSTAPRFEECEPPFSPGCDGACHDPWCGDTVVQAWEQCDPPGPVGVGICPSGICDVGCECQSCGNGILQDAEECEVGIACAPGFSCTPSCECHMCGDGRIGPGEQCGEPGLTCPDGYTCSNCLCRPPGGGGPGGGSNPMMQAPGACCKSFSSLGGQKIAEYSCCGGQDLTTPTGQHYNCCVTPDLPQCNPYCQLTACVPPYVLSTLLGRCVLEEAVVQKTQIAPQPSTPAVTNCIAGYVLKDGQCVQEQQPVQQAPVQKEGKIVTAKKGHMIIINAVLLLAIIGMIVYMISRRRKTPVVVPPVPISTKLPEAEVPKFEPKKFETSKVEPEVKIPLKKMEMPKSPNYDKVESELKDLEESYDKLEKMIKSMKSKKV